MDRLRALVDPFARGHNHDGASCQVLKLGSQGRRPFGSGGGAGALESASGLDDVRSAGNPYAWAIVFHLDTAPAIPPCDSRDKYLQGGRFGPFKNRSSGIDRQSVSIRLGV